jgi:hypothetical protein
MRLVVAPVGFLNRLHPGVPRPNVDSLRLLVNTHHRPSIQSKGDKNTGRATEQARSAAGHLPGTLPLNNRRQSVLAPCAIADAPSAMFLKVAAVFSAIAGESG